ncbi:hypothetical protein Aspvir_002884 [Aspergillus viridinutans]|uniref:Copper acquisition factor BIM1-like domain-containing protein n=1 Tax=Aspergillus viridinutans TaxID=75553 RepID=A0A9P3F663_ASPVI|nr:uncharacterized protein Aspvir_002884 [Aspergillus viridinutans]GIK07227.1 hypothetical protein Aspvir_002884 [Aspergillus viridinutans]
MRIPAIEVGHEYYPVPTVSANVEAGSNATVRIIYTADEHGATEDETFYACPNITYTPTRRFTDQVPSFNMAATSSPQSRQPLRRVQSLQRELLLARWPPQEMRKGLSLVYLVVPSPAWWLVRLLR